MANLQKVILIIKHGALGDFILAMSAIRAIRHHHPQDYLILLTTQRFESFARQSGYFDEIWIDNRPKIFQIKECLGVVKKLRGGERRLRFSRVYDLQTSNRSSFYYKFLPWPKPEWVGIAKGCSHFHAHPQRKTLPSFERLKTQVQLAGISEVPLDRFDWLNEDVEQFSIPQPYALIAPGTSPKRPEKLWPIQHFVEVIQWLGEKQIPSVLIGTAIEEERISKMMGLVPKNFVINLCSKTSLGHLAALGRKAKIAIGGDTGPMHVFGAVDCPQIVLYGTTDPKKLKPLGRHTHILHNPILSQLPAKQVIDYISCRIWSNISAIAGRE